MMRRVLPVLFAMSLSACGQSGTYLAPLEPRPSASPTSTPTPNNPSEPTPDPSASSEPTSNAVPASVPRGNQRLASGDRLGWGFALNHLDDQGNGVLLWSLGDPMGQRFAGFKPTTPIPRGSFPTEHLTWELDSQGNGTAFYQLSGATTGLEYAKQEIHVYQVNQHLPQANPLIWANSALVGKFTDETGNGWLLTVSTPPEGTSIRTPVPASKYQAYRLQNHQLLSHQVKSLPAGLRGERFVLDPQGNGLAVWKAEAAAGKESLWIQRLEQFAPAAEPEQLAANATHWRLHEQNGNGLLYWINSDNQNIALSYEMLSLANYRTGQRLTSLLANSNETRRLEAAQLNANGNGTLAWYVQENSAANNGPVTRYVLQAVQAYQLGSSKALPSTQDDEPLLPSLHLDRQGRGLAIWRQQPRRMNTEFEPNKEIRLLAIPLENYLPSDQALTISDSQQASVDALNIKLSPEGHGLIAWIQFNQRCEQVGCSLDQTVWSRAVYDFRIP